MEGDTIRASSSGDMLVDLWINGAMRQLVITGEAIAAAAGAERAAAMDEDARRDFVRTRMALVQSAARTALAEQGNDALFITLKAACLVDPDLPRGGERRQRDRRAKDRREREPAGLMPALDDRRRVDRRRRDRRGILPAETQA